MSKASCSEDVQVSKVKVEENGKQATFLNPGRVVFTRTRVDGCLIRGAPGCDWWIARERKDSVLIELKGCDVSRALDQIQATFMFLKAKKCLTSRMAALIVCKSPSSHPRFTTKLQRLKAQLSKEYKAPLHIVTGAYEYNLDKVLSHLGPL